MFINDFDAYESLFCPMFIKSQIAKGLGNELNMHDKAKVPKRSFLHMNERRLE